MFSHINCTFDRTFVVPCLINGSFAFGREGISLTMIVFFWGISIMANILFETRSVLEECKSTYISLPLIFEKVSHNSSTFTSIISLSISYAKHNVNKYHFTCRLQ